jgi:hypothetical protein
MPTRQQFKSSASNQANTKEEKEKRGLQTPLKPSPSTLLSQFLFNVFDITCLCILVVILVAEEDESTMLARLLLDLLLELMFMGGRQGREKGKCGFHAHDGKWLLTHR